MQKSWRNIAIALAGTAQAVSLVEQLAKTGYLDSDAFRASVNSLFVQNPETTASVFGDIHQLRRGLETLEELLRNHRAPKNGDILRYVIGVMHLQKRLAKRSDMLHVIGNRLEKAQEQVAHFDDVSHDNVVANIADIYTDTISTFQYRIQVMGEYTYLQQARVANQIRVLLLAAIRATTLWRQVGGSRWQLLFYRRQILETTEALLREIRTH